MGRDKKNELRTEHYTQLIRNFMEEPAWRGLSSSAQALYPWLRMEWHGPRANNNGKIRLSVRQASVKMGVSVNTANRAFYDLQAKGFLVVTESARLGIGGKGQCPSFELTELGVANSPSAAGRKLYKKWQLGADFPIAKAMTNNPLGNNGENRTLSSNWGRTVIKMKTVK